MSTDELIEVLRGRGLRLALDEDGRPQLRGPRTEATPALLRVVGLHREALLAKLGLEGAWPSPPAAKEPEPAPIEAPARGPAEPEPAPVQAPTRGPEKPKPAAGLSWVGLGVYRSLLGLGIEFELDGQGRLLARPREKVTSEVAATIKEWRDAIALYVEWGGEFWE